MTPRYRPFLIPVGQVVVYTFADHVLSTVVPTEGMPEQTLSIGGTAKLVCVGHRRGLNGEPLYCLAGRAIQMPEWDAECDRRPWLYQAWMQRYQAWVGFFTAGAKFEEIELCEGVVIRQMPTLDEYLQGLQMKMIPEWRQAVFGERQLTRTLKPTEIVCELEVGP